MKFLFRKWFLRKKREFLKDIGLKLTLIIKKEGEKWNMDNIDILGGLIPLQVQSQMMMIYLKNMMNKMIKSFGMNSNWLNFN
jgi:ethanolamine transporter EutH